MAEKQKSTVVLVDGSSYLFRAYHALPPLTTSKGVPSGAMYGVINMLKKLIKDERPDYIAVVFDTKSKNFRHELYPEYKANRPPMPEELSVQIQPMHDIIQAMGLPLLAIEGMEADDVIGTLAFEAKKANFKVLISTGDKDFAQIVDEDITLINTMTNVTLDIKGVEEKFGIGPDKIIDYLALMGDSVDNIPGVPKVGPKTAVKWLKAYDSLAGVVEHAAEIKGKVGDNLRASLDTLSLSQKLVTIQTDMDLNVHLETLKALPPDNDKLRAFFTEFEFKTWLKNLNDNEQNVSEKNMPLGNVEKETPSFEHEVVLTQEAWDKWLGLLKKAKQFAFDTETTSLNGMSAEIVGFSFAILKEMAVYVPLAHDYVDVPKQLNRDKILADLKPILEDKTIGKIGQNIKYDMHILENYGIKLNNIAHDTMLASYVLNSQATRHDMDSLAKLYLDYQTTSYTEVAGKGAKQIPFSEVPIEVAGQYAAEDASVTLQLSEVLWPKLEEHAGLVSVYETIEKPLIPVLLSMEREGVKIDAVKLQAQSEVVTQKLKDLAEEAFVLAGEEFNLASPKQLQAILFEKLQLPVSEKTPKGQPSTAESVLQTLSVDYEIPKIILAHRTLSKLKSTYIDKLPLQINDKTGRVHTSYHQAVTATGRLSSSDPNLQNIPTRSEEGRKIRAAFIAREGFQILSADYSQIELRIMAHLSQDEGLLTAFQEGEDVHRFTASEIFGINREDVTDLQRHRAKAINFGLIYGMSAYGLGKQLGIEKKAAGEYMERYFARYPKVKSYMDDIRVQAAKQGFAQTLFGRRIYLSDIRSKNVMRQRQAERLAINAPMQGTAADIIKRAMIALHPWVLDNADNIKMIMQVHDELVFEVAKGFVAEAKDTIQTKMMGAADLVVPLPVSIGCGNNWDEAH